jgi:hypothetical protein
MHRGRRSDDYRPGNNPRIDSRNVTNHSLRGVNFIIPKSETRFYSRNMILKLFPENPDERILRKIVEALQRGEVIIVPTDTIYAFCCDIKQARAFEKICRIKKMDPEKANFSVVCASLSNLSEYTVQIPNHIFKIIRKALPGPYTFQKYFRARREQLASG